MKVFSIIVLMSTIQYYFQTPFIQLVAKFQRESFLTYRTQYGCSDEQCPIRGIKIEKPTSCIFKILYQLVSMMKYKSKCVFYIHKTMNLPRGLPLRLPPSAHSAPNTPSRVLHTFGVSFSVSMLKLIFKPKTIHN